MYLNYTDLKIFIGFDTNSCLWKVLASKISEYDTDLQAGFTNKGIQQ